MGWNESRISLLAPGWKMRSEQSATDAATVGGIPLRILYPEKISNSNSTAVSPQALQRWLEAYGFEVRQQSEYGNQLQWDDIEASLGIESGELAEVVLTLELNRESPSRLDVWKTLVRGLSKIWGLSIYASDLGRTVEIDQFDRILAKTPAWVAFSSKFNWSEPGAE